MPPPRSDVKHNHRDYFNRHDGCPRCAELAATPPPAPELRTLAEAQAALTPGERSAFDRAVMRHLAPPPPPVCWLCMGPHAVEECPLYERARLSGNMPIFLRNQERKDGTA